MINEPRELGRKHYCREGNYSVLKIHPVPYGYRQTMGVKTMRLVKRNKKTNSFISDMRKIANIHKFQANSK